VQEPGLVWASSTCRTPCSPDRRSIRYLISTINRLLDRFCRLGAPGKHTKHQSRTAAVKAQWRRPPHQHNPACKESALFMRAVSRQDSATPYSQLLYAGLRYASAKQNVDGSRLLSGARAMLSDNHSAGPLDAIKASMALEEG
jgi:hypothetical protein